MNPLHRWLHKDRSPSVDSERWVVVDTETSGLDPEHDRLIAIPDLKEYLSQCGIEMRR